MNKRLVASFLTAVLVLQTSAFAATHTVSSTSQQNVKAKVESTNKQETNEEETADANTTAPSQMDDKPVLTLDEAVEKGLKNNFLFQQVENKADLAKLIKENANNVKNDLINAESDLRSAESALADGRDQLVSSGAKLEKAQEALREGRFPITITSGTILEMLKGNPTLQQMFSAAVGGNTSIVLAHEGDSISDFCSSSMGQTMAMMGYGEAEITSALESQISKQESAYAAGQEKLESGTREYNEGQAKYQASLKYALSSVSNKLSTSTISSLDGKPLGELIEKMSTKQDEVTNYSIEIYRNQVALLIQKDYFEALKQQELLKVKQKAEERGRVQYEMAKAAFEVGMKSKDDMNIAKTYYDSTIMNTALQEKEYNTAMLELKKTLNVKMSEDFCVQAVEPDINETFDLNKGIESGLRLRLEMKTAEAGKDLYGYLMTAVNDSGYSSSSNQYKEVKLLQKQADIAYESQKVEVEKGIRDSYQTVQATRKLVETAQDLRENAESTLEAAKLKYEAGYAYSNSLLASLNLQQMAGTMVEVLAAEENLANIEEKQIEAMNGYNLARLKYLNDIGELPYKK